MSRPSPRALERFGRSFRQLSRRTYATNPLPPPPPSSGATQLPTRRLISVHGADAPKFLQGIVTNNALASPHQGFYAAFLTAPGKVLNDVFIYPTLGSQWHRDVSRDEEPGFLVEVDAGQVELLQKHLKRHKLRSKLALRVLDEGELDVWSLWREEDRWTAHSGAATEGLGIGLTDGRAPGMGKRLLLPGAGLGSQAVTETALDGLERADPSAYTIRRYSRGVAEGQTEIRREDSLPMNCNIDLMGGIDFKKGCYIGQELTIRTHHTGVVRRRILPVALYAPGSPPPEKLEYDPPAASVATPPPPPPETGADIYREDQRRRATGRFIGGVGNVGLALCRLEQMSDLVVSGEGSAFGAADRFVVLGADGREVGVRAFVPDWVRGKVREPRIQRRVE